MVTLSEIENVLKQVAIAQRSSYIPTCPRCGREAMEHFCASTTFGALSRRADIYVCSACGEEEAEEDYYKATKLPISNWAIIKEPERRQRKKFEKTKTKVPAPF